MDAERAETYLRLMAESALRRATGGEPDSVWQYVGRVRYVASALALLGLLDEERAESIPADLEAAVAIRSRQHRGSLMPHQPQRTGIQYYSRLIAQGGATPGGILVSAGTTPPQPAATGPVRAVPVGRVTRVRNTEDAADVWLLSLVRTPGESMFSVAGWISGWSAGQPLFRSGRIRAVDDRGRAYVAFYFDHHMGKGHAVDGWLRLGQPLAADARHIDLYEDPADEPLFRVELAERPGGRVVAEPLEPSGLAERMIDVIGEGMLARLPEPGFVPESPDDLVAALEEAGALAPDSPATSRLAALCQRAGLDAGHSLVAAVAEGRRPAAELPEHWTSLLAYFGRRHRPLVKHGAAPLAQVLPELDGIRFILAGLRSAPDQTLLSVAALGLPPEGERSPFGGPWLQWFPWWLRDNAGQWHLAHVESSESQDSGLTTLGLSVVPPLPRTATRLEVIVSGRAARLRVGVAVNWVDIHD